ncbi:MAG: WYL domain-containing protein [Planctomycetota bacterium]
MNEQEFGHLQRLQKLAAERLTAIIVYRKPGENWRTERRIEPYSLTYNAAGNLIVLTWQQDPFVPSPSWRHFRIDRMTSVQNGKTTFEPRTSLTLHKGDLKRFVFGATAEEAPKPTPASPEELYTRALDSALLDAQLDDNEFVQLRQLQNNLDPEQIKAIHARLYSLTLDEIIMDARINDEEEAQIVRTGAFLSELGWKPGDSSRRKPWWRRVFK